MSRFNIVVESSEATVVAEYTPSPRKADSYQSEAELEKEFIHNLQEQGYEYIKIGSEADLIGNLRTQIEKLNDFTFSQSEWFRFFNEYIARPGDSIEDKTNRVQVDNVCSFRLDNGSTKNIKIIDKKNIHNNSLQVINQYVEESGARDVRYDVTILVNGLPMVHTELKRRGVALKEAFNQIKRYDRDSFWAGSGLYNYVQVFVISNGTETKYYSNTTRSSHIKELSGEGRKKSKRTSNSFEFTSYWADGNNKIIPDLIDFTKTFFSKHTLLNILTRYCVFDSDQKLLVMRPYQIVATERILNRIEISTNYKTLGSTDAGGYIWHTTGSGKTLTSFKTALLATQLPYIDKVLFVVDRKDLDYQTMKEYDRFEKGAANGNNNTHILQCQLENKDPKTDATRDYKIIVTTIQKLSVFIKKNPQHEVYDKHCVIIFDECHRSQFGDMHMDITKHFKNCNLFGFTGTPIFAENAGSSSNPQLRTTEQAFGDKLHTYTIVDAINDKNVLPFRIDYLQMMHSKEGIADADISAIDRERAMMDPRRITEVTKYVLDHFDQKTKRSFYYDYRKVANISESIMHRDAEEKITTKLNGFNSIFATSSIDMAKLYYNEFKKQLAESGRKLKIATIFSFAANEDLDDTSGFMGDEDVDTSTLDQSSRDFLDSAIADYNKMFSVDYDTSSDKFQNYYKDVSMRMKNRELDLLIVVNMFLTGFDATTLNTLWVDKDLKMHGLIQAFSRTNRILNSIKTYGNIICFRNLQDKVDDAVALFGDKEASGIVLLKTFSEYFNGYDESDGKHVDGYTDLINKLRENYPVGERPIGEENQKEFIKLFGKILRLRNILQSFDEFAEQDILTPRDLQDYQSVYLNLRDELRPETPDKEVINDDLVFEVELIRQTEVNVDYILTLVVKYHDSHCKNKEILVDIDKAVSSSLELRSKKELIHEFIRTYTNTGEEIRDTWQKFVNVEREKELNSIIEEENLNSDETKRLILNAFRDGAMKTSGTDVDRIMPKMSRFGAAGAQRNEKRNGIIAKLVSFFDKYFGAY